MSPAVPADWTGYASAAALIALAPTLAGAAMTPAARSRGVWELEKLAPALCEPTGAELLARADELVRLQVGGVLDPAHALPIAVGHGSHVLSRRGRWVHDFALAAMARVAATAAGGLPVPFLAAAHLLRTRSEGVLELDGSGDDHAQLGEDEMERLAAGDDSVLDVPSAALVAQRLTAVVETSLWPPGDSAAVALAGVLVLATVADTSQAEADFLVDGHRMTLDAAIGDLAGMAPGEALAAARAQLPAEVRRDHFVLRRLIEDRAMLLAGWPRDQQERVQRLIGVLGQSAGGGALRRDLATSTMAVLGLGSISRWRMRAAQPVVAVEALVAEADAAADPRLRA
jgi:hypothetical protein